MLNVKASRPALAAGLAVVMVLGYTLARPASRPATHPAAPVTQGADSNEFAPFVFIHAGDPELGSPDLPGTSKRFGQLAQRANSIGAAMVVIAGDLVRNGDKADQLRALDEALKTFKMPVRAVPGNHDDEAAFRKRFGPENSVFTVSNCDFVCVNSNDLSASALSWLEEALKLAVDRRRTHVFVVMHHPPEDDKAIGKLLSKYGVAAVLCGHLHKTGEAPHKGYVTYWVSGTAKFRDENGLRYNVFRVYKDRIEQESLPLEKDVGRMAPTSSMPASRPQTHGMP